MWINTPRKKRKNRFRERESESERVRETRHESGFFFDENYKHKNMKNTEKKYWRKLWQGCRYVWYELSIIATNTLLDLFEINIYNSISIEGKTLMETWQLWIISWFYFELLLQFWFFIGDLKIFQAFSILLCIKMWNCWTMNNGFWYRKDFSL